MIKRWLILLALGLASCTPAPSNSKPTRLPDARSTGELVVLIANGANSFYVDAEGKYAGLDFDLVTRFASEQNLKVKLVVVPRLDVMSDKLMRGEAHLGVGLGRREQTGLAFGPAYLRASPVLVYREDSRKPKHLDDLGEGMTMVAGMFAPMMHDLETRHSQLRWVAAQQQDPEELIEKVDNGLLDYAIVPSSSLALLKHYYPRVVEAFSLKYTQALAFAWPSDTAAPMQQALHTFFSKILQDGSLSRLIDRYYGHSERLQAQDVNSFLNRRRTVLPKYRARFIEAQARYGIDWRMLAALSYQESHWDPFATSDYGVRGMMMLTTETADRLKVSDRLDATQSIMGGARYLGMLRDTLPARIPEPDRTWMAMAGYNIGMAHLEDARVLAQRQKKSPDSWADLKTVIPLLRNYEYFSTLKYGFARGGETVIFVENIRSYFDVLSRFEQPAQLMFPPFDEAVTVSNPEGVRLGIDVAARQQM